MRWASAKTCSLCALLATAAACQGFSINGNGSGTAMATSGGPGPVPCPANSVRQPDGVCECFQNYSECQDDAGDLICANVKLDNANCGDCGTACPNGESCLGGTCTCHLTTCITDAGESLCTDPMTDPLNCNGCGNPCPPGFLCGLGVCTGCDAYPTFAVCSSDAGAYCVDATTNNNCGGCGIQCPENAYCAAPAGAGGTCICADGGQGTDVQDCAGECTDTRRDPNNCGGCGTPCSPPTTECVDGECQ